MPSSLSFSTAGISGAFGRTFNAVQGRVGDMLIARIIGSLPSGGTHVQVNGVKALVQGTLGGRVGDMVLLEVTAYRQPPDSSTGATARTAIPDTGETRPPIEIVLRQSGRLLRLPVLVKSVISQSASGELSSAALKAPHPTLNPNPTSTQPNTCSMPTVKAVSAWIGELRKKLVQPKGLKAEPGASNHRGVISPSGYDRLSSSGPEPQLGPPGEQLREPDNDAGWIALRLDSGPVRFRFRQRRSQRQAPQGIPELEAVFLLNLDNVGAVRTDLRMGAGTLSVDFFVENSAYRRHFVAAIPDLKATLAPLAAHYRCRVMVSPGKIDALLTETGLHAGALPLDVRI